MILLQSLGILLYFTVAYIFYSAYLPKCQGNKPSSFKLDLLLALIAILWLPGIILVVGVLFLTVIVYAIKHYGFRKTLEKGNK